MQIHIKKRIKTIASALMLLLFFVPSDQILAQTEANKLVIVADKLSIKANEDIFITARTFSLANKEITFKSSPSTGVVFDPVFCTTDNSSRQINTCQVGFKAAKGTYKISASMPFNGTITSNEITISVTKNGAAIENCTSPKKIIIENGNSKCVDPISYCPIGEVLIGNTCTKCVAPQISNSTNDGCITPVTAGVVCTGEQQLNSEGTGCVEKTITTYKPLAPIPGIENIDTEISETNPCPFGNYLNTIIKIVIGFSAVLAMVMIVAGGVEYMSSELISGKQSGKDKIGNAILGLVIALGSYLILNTINPQLLDACLNKLPEASITVIKTFNLSGGMTFDGNPISVDFNKEAHPAAKLATQKTGVDTALILAIFAQETSSGKNVGTCDYKTANMRTAPDTPDELAILKEITNDWATVKMSCSGGGSSHGGAIGFTQFLPSTWKEFRGQAEALLGREPGKLNAWNIEDALMMSALKLKSDGGVSDPKKAACRYFGSCSVQVKCGNGTTGSYGDCVMGKKASIQKQIDDAIKNGEISA